MNEAELRDFLTRQDQELKGLIVDRVNKSASETSARLLQIEQRLASPSPGGGGGSIGSAQSLGSLVTSSEGYKQVQRGGRSSGRIEVKTFSEKAIVSGTWSSPPYYMPTIQTPSPRRLRVRDLLPTIPVVQNLVEWPNEDSFVNNSSYQLLEGDLKAESAATFSLKQSGIATVATWLTVSKQILDDSVALQNWIDQRLLYKLSLFIESELLFGVGGAGKIRGLMPQSTPANFLPTNLLDGSAQAIAQLANTDTEATAIICNSADFWQMRQQKAISSGVYLASDPLSGGPPVLWGIPCVPTPSMTQGQFLVGDFQGGAAIFDRLAATLELSREHSDYFVRNLAAVLCEERLTLAVFRPGSFVSATVHAGS